MSEANASSDLERAEHINTGAKEGLKAVGAYKWNGSSWEAFDGATEEKQDSMITLLGNIAAALGAESGAGTELSSAVLTTVAQDTAVTFPDTPCKVAFLIAGPKNQDFIAWGDTNVNADFANANAGLNANIMYPGDPKTLVIQNLNEISISGIAAGEKLLVTYTT